MKTIYFCWMRRSGRTLGFRVTAPGPAPDLSPERDFHGESPFLGDDDHDFHGDSHFLGDDFEDEEERACGSSDEDEVDDDAIGLAEQKVILALGLGHYNPADLELMDELAVISGEYTFFSQADRILMDEIDDLLGGTAAEGVAFPFSRVCHLGVDTAKKRTTLNPTSTMQGIWQAKHSISDAAMRDLIAMAKHEEFDPQRLRSGKTLRRNRDLLPLLPLYSLDVEQTILPYYDAEGDLVSTRLVEFPFFGLVPDVIPRFLETLPSLDSLTTTAL